MTPEQYAQAQLERYNAHDLTGFLALYGEDIEVYDFPSELRMRGKAAIRERYERILFPGSTVHARVDQRIVVGNRVIDHEIVTGHPLVGDCALVVIYEVGATGIEKMWTMREG
ncbi:hypothetical protein FNU76_12705 [Chitinimonas arctica]|uniref:SnoaL-like domain-containing protein n=1 Tax=Chitinimonas arctica TaxID=2594795 RepID=A0A516SG68_9NEIS|nr:nuclear transport factor 2 family protein [Chitinimonas arctica]QDQ27155.1 hypothetical protein FNU76_12705 [Chitinimonas arctica]